MHATTLSVFPPVLLVAVGVACNSAVVPVIPVGQGPLTGPPNFIGVVSKDTPVSGLSPEGYFSEYVIWVVISPDSTVSATFGTSTPVLQRKTRGTLTYRSASWIRVGDTVEVWEDGSYVLGGDPAVWRSPNYIGTRQIVVRG
jgi:hypothetical protein